MCVWSPSSTYSAFYFVPIILFFHFFFTDRFCFFTIFFSHFFHSFFSSFLITPGEKRPTFYIGRHEGRPVRAKKDEGHHP